MLPLDVEVELPLTITHKAPNLIACCFTGSAHLLTLPRTDCSNTQLVVRADIWLVFGYFGTPHEPNIEPSHRWPVSSLRSSMSLLIDQ